MKAAERDQLAKDHSKISQDLANDHKKSAANAVEKEAELYKLAEPGSDIDIYIEENKKSLTNEQIKTLEDLKNEEKSNLTGYVSLNKANIRQLRKIYRIYEVKDKYFDFPFLEKYKSNFASYISDRLDLGRTQSYNEAAVCELIHRTGSFELLDSESFIQTKGALTILIKIARISIKGIEDEEKIKIQNKLLKKVKESLDSKDVSVKMITSEIEELTPEKKSTNKKKALQQKRD